MFLTQSELISKVSAKYKYHMDKKALTAFVLSEY